MSTPPPPPPPGSEDIPPPPETESYASIPPPAAESEQYQSDLLKRRKFFSWKKFGGEGFLVSVAIHVLLVILALFYVVSKYVAPKAKEPDVFATGAGGGSSGDKAKSFEHKMKSRATMVKTPSRIVSKSASASISLPDTPATNMSSFASGLSAGGMSKGAGGGSGGGEGTGIGIGKGGGKNFVSLFGARGMGAVSGLPGTFYDGKQTPKGKPTKYAGGENENADATWQFGSEVLEVIAATWSPSTVENKFFKAPEQLTASQIFIPPMRAEGAPKAYGVEDQVKPARWVAWYKGTVVAPKSGKFRFWGNADDVIALRWNRKFTMASGFRVLKGPKNNTVKMETEKGATPVPFHSSPWLDVEKGREYPIEIIISELPGGNFWAYLLMEEYDSAKHDGDGKYFLFRMGAEDLPEGLTDKTGLSVDMTGKGLIWKAKAAKADAVR